ncbi:tRNA (5-methylaminomethyl-2-thiouridine)(34)-methyltransferase MnmD [Peijinzhouia sedimentorum]
MEIKVIQTEDGSHSLYRPDIMESYHSFHGALQESVHVYIKAGLDEFASRNVGTIQVFEVGFGTGLNALLTWQWAIENKREVVYTTIEPYPLTEEIWSQLNFAQSFSNPIESQKIFEQLHACDWEQTNQIHPNFQFTKNQSKLEDFILANNRFHVVFFDAFAPKKQPELWEETALKKVFDSMQPKGILTTYCAQGQFQRTLQSAGFEVERIAGPRGKKHMVRGIKMEK